MHACKSACAETGGNFSSKDDTRAPNLHYIPLNGLTPSVFIYFFPRSLHSRLVWNHFLLISLYPAIVRIFLFMQSIQFYLQFLFWVSSESWWHVSKFPTSISSQISSVFGECSILLQYPRLIAFLLPFIFYFFIQTAKLGFSFLIKHQDFCIPLPELHSSAHVE